MGNYDSLSKDTKKAMEDLTKAKNEMDSLAEVKQKFARLELQLKREQRMAFGDPVQRLVANEEFRARIDAVVRKAISLNEESTAWPRRS